MKYIYEILLVSSVFIFACSKKKTSNTFDANTVVVEKLNTIHNQTDILWYCDKDVFLGDLKINIGCNNTTDLIYSLTDLKKSFDLPIIKEIDKLADENTGGSERFIDILFEDYQGKLKISIYDFKLPEFYLTNKKIPFKIAGKNIKVGHSEVELKKLLSSLGGFKENQNKSIHISLDYSIIEFGIDEGKISYIAFNGNYFY